MLLLKIFHKLRYYMIYRITEHYARGEEKLIAEFYVLNDAQFFMRIKASINEDLRKQIIYRLYNDYELLHELNTENISVTHAKYAESNDDFNNTIPFTYQVMVKPISTLIAKTIAQFNDKNDAILFITRKFEDFSDNDNDLLMILKDNILIDTLNKTTSTNRKQSAEATTNENQSAYKLSPLSTRPTPDSGPADYWVKNETDDENI